MRITTISLFFLASSLLSACNMAQFTRLSPEDSEQLADTTSTRSDAITTPAYNTQLLQPAWFEVSAENPPHLVDEYFKYDEFILSKADTTPTGYDIVWDRIRQGFKLPDSENRRVLAEMKWYSRHQSYIDRVVNRAEPYMYFIMEEIDKRGIPAELALLPIVESAFQAFAYSHGQAAGIWQFIPSTGRHYGLKQNWWYDGRRDVYESTLAALDYLQYLARAFKGDWLHALAAYNSGIGTVTRAIKKNKRRGKPTDFWHLSLPKETQGYVPKLIALTKLVRQPEKNNINLRCIENAPYFGVVSTGSQIDLAVAAELAGISIEELYRLNPGNNRWATDPKGQHKLLLPVENVDRFKTALAKIPAKDRVTWKRYKVKPDETLSHIALKNHVTVQDIKRINGLRSNSIRVGKHLLIPVAQKGMRHYALSKSQRTNKRMAIKRKGKGKKVFHVVKDGDSLWDISRLYKVGTQQLARWNGMSPKDFLRVGQKLVIWTKQKLATSSLSSGIVGDFVRSIRYKVRNGDSLYRIAQRFNVSITDLARWNPSRKGRYLQPGQTIKLYVDITKQAGNG